jgi:uncharacterized protein YjbI with pentapeptide repeats
LYLIGVYLIRRASHRLIGVYLTGVHFMGVYLIGLYLTGVHLMGVYLINVHLTGVRLMGVYLTRRASHRRVSLKACILEACMSWAHVMGVSLSRACISKARI